LDRARKDAEQTMKKYDDRKRARSIERYYGAEMERLLSQLDVTNISLESVRRIDARIQETGSHLPRAILAYFFAIVHTIYQYSTSTLCPLVIDSPHQQDQDADNWARILECIRDECPETSQLVLATTTDTGFDYGGSVLELSEKNHVLTDREFSDASDEIRPLLEAMNLDRR